MNIQRLEYYTCLHHPNIEFNELFEFRYKNSLVPIIPVGNTITGHEIKYQDGHKTKTFNMEKEVLLSVYNIEKPLRDISFLPGTVSFNNLCIITYDVVDIHNNFEKFLSFEEIAECYNMDIKDVKSSYYNSQKLGEIHSIKQVWIRAKDF